MAATKNHRENAGTLGWYPSCLSPPVGALSKGIYPINSHYIRWLWGWLLRGLHPKGTTIFPLKNWIPQKVCGRSHDFFVAYFLFPTKIFYDPFWILGATHFLWEKTAKAFKDFGFHWALPCCVDYDGVGGHEWWPGGDCLVYFLAHRKRILWSGRGEHVGEDAQPTVTLFCSDTWLFVQFFTPRIARQFSIGFSWKMHENGGLMIYFI